MLALQLLPRSLSWPALSVHSTTQPSAYIIHTPSSPRNTYGWPSCLTLMHPITGVTLLSHDPRPRGPQQAGQLARELTLLAQGVTDEVAFKVQNVTVREL